MSAFSDTPDDNLITNGTVSAIVKDEVNGIVYLGGAFTNLSHNTGSFTSLSASTGNYNSSYPNVNGAVTSAVSDGSGGWYIAGAFTQIGSIARNRIAHILANGTVDSSFNPNSNGTINALAISPNGNTLYVGGLFSVIGGQSRNFIAALNVSDGLATSWNPNPTGTPVNTLAVSSDGNTIYVGGAFTTIGGQTRNRIAALNASDGLATSWNPNATSGAVNTLAISSNGSTVYVGGTFINIGGQARSKIAALNVSDGLATSWDPNSQNLVSAMVFSSNGSILYVGGSFTSIGGQSRNFIAALNVSDGLATAWDPNANSTVSALTLSSNGNTIYAGGQFATIGGQSRDRIAALNTSDGLATSWNPSASTNISVLALSADNSTVYAGGGQGLGFGSQTRNRIAALNASDGTLLSWNPNAGSTVSALALSSDGSTVYAGGAFTTIGGQTRNRIAALNASDGLATSWDPNATSGAVNTLIVSSNGNTVYTGGTFINIGGQARNRIAALNTSDGLAASWNPNATSGAVNVLKLSSNNSTLYVGGTFTNIGGQARNRIAALNTSDGLAASWNPNAASDVNVLALSSDGNLLYVGGAFSTTIGGQTRPYLAALNTSDGLATSWNPSPDFSVNSLALSSDDATVYAGGQFSIIGGQSRGSIAALNASDGLATSWNPNNIYTGQAFSALTISSDGNALYAGGAFITLSNIVHRGFAQFSLAAETAASTSADPARKNPYPTLYSIIPNSVKANSGPIEVTLIGEDFLGTEISSDSKVFFNGNDLVVRPMGHNRMTVIVPKDFLAKPGTFGMYVNNPGPGGGDSDLLKFIVIEESKSAESSDLNTPPATSTEQSELKTDSNFEAAEATPIPEESLFAKLLKQLRNLVNELLNKNINVPAEIQLSVGRYKGLFRHDVSRGVSDGEVWLLQRFLNDKGFIISESGPGSLGNETFYFGPATQAALVAFQKANNIQPASGNFGPTTRAFIESLSE